MAAEYMGPLMGGLTLVFILALMTHPQETLLAFVFGIAIYLAL